MSERPEIVRSSDDGAVSAGVSAAPRSEERAGRRRRRRERIASPHLSRFRLATALLVGLGVAALVVAATVAVNGRSSSATGPKWSAWSPSDHGTQGATEIANYLAPMYRATPADQLDVVTQVNLESPTQQAAQAAAAASGTAAPANSGSGLQVAVRPSASSSQVSLLGGKTIGYNLCGIGGSKCAIGIGQPSQNRLLLLRREALELALYTFKYISGTQNVVAILPPGRAQVTGTLSKKPPTSRSAPTSKPIDIAVLFQRQELAPLLSHPLDETLPEPVPPSVSQMSSAPEAQLVSEVTARGLFSEQIQQAQDGSSLIVLNPLPPQ